MESNTTEKNESTILFGLFALFNGRFIKLEWFYQIDSCSISGFELNLTLFRSGFPLQYGCFFFISLVRNYLVSNMKNLQLTVRIFFLVIRILRLKRTASGLWMKKVEMRTSKKNAFNLLYPLPVLNVHPPLKLHNLQTILGCSPDFATTVNLTRIRRPSTRTHRRRPSCLHPLRRSPSRRRTNIRRD